MLDTRVPFCRLYIHLPTNYATTFRNDSFMCLWQANPADFDRLLRTRTVWKKKAGYEKKVGGRRFKRFDFFRNFTISSVNLLWRVAVVFKTEMKNPSSNFTWSKIKCISIKRYQNWSISVLHAFLKATLGLKTATDSTSPKAGHLSSKSPHPWHHSLDTKHFFLHVKYGIWFVISFMRKSMFNKKWYFFMGDGLPFFFSKNQNSEFENIYSNLWFSQPEDAGDTWYLCR
jgi:hypothetical protein